MERIRQSFDRFFFDGCDPRVVSLFRIGYSILLAIYVAVLFPDADRWFTDEGVLTAATSRRMTGDAHGSPFFYVSSAPAVRWCLGILMVHAVMLLLGIWSRLQVAFVFIWIVALQHRNLMTMDGEDVVFRWFAFIMIFLPLDYRWSLARWFRGRESTETPAQTWALRLIQIQMAVIFLSSAVCKLLGQTWWDGTALFYVAHMGDYFGRVSLLSSWFDEPWVYRSLTWGAVTIELIVSILIWFPRFRVVCMIAAIALHVGIELTMNLFLFQWLMVIGWLSFVKLQPLPRPCRRPELV